MAGQEKGKRSEIHFRINEISNEGVSGVCGDHRYCIETREGRILWYFEDEPEKVRAAPDLQRALYEVVAAVQREPQDELSCYCGVCEEMRASPIRVFHAAVIFEDRDIGIDYVFLTTAASGKTFEAAVEWAATNAAKRSRSTESACARFLKYMEKRGFVPTSHLALGELDVILSRDHHTVTATVQQQLQ